MGNIRSLLLAQATLASVERVRLELWGHPRALASAMQWRAAAPPATVQRLTAEAEAFAASHGGTVSAWELHILTDAPPYVSAIEIEGSPHRWSIHWLPGVTYKQIETVVKANRESRGLLPEKSQPFNTYDERIVAMLCRRGGPPSAQGQVEAEWESFRLDWNAAGPKRPIESWQGMANRWHDTLMPKVAHVAPLPWERPGVSPTSSAHGQES